MHENELVVDKLCKNKKIFFQSLVDVPSAVRVPLSIKTSFVGASKEIPLYTISTKVTLR